MGHLLQTCNPIWVGRYFPLMLRNDFMYDFIFIKFNFHFRFQKLNSQQILQLETKNKTRRTNKRIKSQRTAAQYVPPTQPF